MPPVEETTEPATETVTAELISQTLFEESDIYQRYEQTLRSWDFLTPSTTPSTEGVEASDEDEEMDAVIDELVRSGPTTIAATFLHMDGNAGWRASVPKLPPISTLFERIVNRRARGDRATDIESLPLLARRRLRQLNRVVDTGARCHYSIDE